MKVKDTNLTKHQTAPDFMSSAQGLFRVCAFLFLAEWKSQKVGFTRSVNGASSLQAQRCNDEWYVFIFEQCHEWSSAMCGDQSLTIRDTFDLHTIEILDQWSSDKKYLRDVIQGGRRLYQLFNGESNPNIGCLVTPICTDMLEMYTIDIVETTNMTKGFT